MPGQFLKKPVLPWVLVILSITALKEWNTAKVFKATAFFDACSILTARPEDVPQNGALVLVDESSLRSMSELHNVRWPWPRSLFAALIAALHHAGAEKILMDFTFFEKSEPEHDDVLAAYAAACEETVLARTSKQKPVIWANGIQVKYPKLFARSRTGLVDLGFDPDGVYRHYHLPGSLAAAALTNKVAYKSDMLRWHGGLGSSSVSLTNVAYAAAPFVVEGERLQRQLREKGVDETNPVEVARGLASGLPPLEERIAVEVRGKVVFVGVNAAGTGDWKAIPVGGIEPGVLVHFTAWMNALRGEFIREAPPWGDVLASVLLTSIILGFGWLRPGGAWIVAVGVGLEVALLGGIFLAFRHGWFLPPALPAASILLAMVGSVSHNFWRESERKREIQAIFGSYVSEQVVNQLLENPDAIKLGGEKKVLTVFFSDLAGFTDLSEKLSPEELVRVVNRYLGAVTDFILDNGGYVDKYIGDAVMGVFGSPEPLENHAAAACRAALASRDWMEQAFRDAPVKLHARIGLNTGEMVIGNVGSERKKNFTVLGDAVNLASRLEAANKDVGTVLLMGEDTEKMIRGQFVTRPMARLRVKGKLLPNQTYELAGNLGAEDDFIRAYTTGYEKYMRREFSAAAVDFRHALSLRPQDRMTQNYLDSCRKFEQSAPGPEWDGVLVLTSK